jgi:CRP-like cAMP-binding protein
MTPDETQALAQEIGRCFPPLGTHLGPDGLVALAGAVKIQRMHAGDELLSQGSPVPTLCLTWDGHFGLRLGDEKSAVELGALPERSMIGEVAFFDGGPVTASVMAMSRVSVALVLTQAAFEEMAVQHPRAAAGLLRALSAVLAERLRFATDRFEEVSAAEHTSVLDRLRVLFGLREGGKGRSA